MAPPMKRPGTTVLPTKERGLFTRLIQEVSDCMPVGDTTTDRP